MTHSHFRKRAAAAKNVVEHSSPEGAPITRGNPMMTTSPALETINAPLTRRQLLMAAIKPPMYTVAISPALVGSMAFYADTGHLHILTLCTMLYAFISCIAWTNLTNDVFDYDTGVDKHKAESIVNIFGGSRRMRHVILMLANVILVTGLYALAKISTMDYTIFFIMLVAVSLGYIYQGPPFRFSYLGLGEPICFTAWTLGVCCAYYSQLILHESYQHIIEKLPTVTQRIQFVLFSLLFDPSRSLFPAALLVAYSVSLILFCSHLHQEEEDRKAGKLSPIVRLGIVRATKVLWVALAGLTVIHLALFFSGWLPWQVFAIVSLSSPHLLRVGQFVQKYQNTPDILRRAKYFVVKFNLFHCIFMSVGFAIVGSLRV